MNQSLFKTIGNTPIVELSRYTPNKKIKIFAKLEGNNPGGSIKDRIALYIIKDALAKGHIDSKKTVIEATSGNTGIGIAMILATMQIPFIAVMSESVSLERRKMIEAYGAKIKLTDGDKGTNHAISIVKQIVLENPSIYYNLDQFSNPGNVIAHYQTTGAEIIRQIPNITHFVAGMGTGGTLMGVGKRLKQYNSAIQIVGIEPKAHSLIQGLRNMKDYIPLIFEPDKLDKIISIEDDEAFELSKDLVKNEGISVGISSGANLWGSMQIASKLKSGHTASRFPALFLLSQHRFFHIVS
ncbi:cysteine synthase B [Candidatus Beckwithbacteria bacterium CG23_combo_of_CG06-09_8_20_14_all_34_8]|uniref:Cysteine synthase B n=1 Tax=Candidatus Beckwithbacteria bacterium CG23_combo_of_CG06-09_8_20_14_all_34_8 TaxID=1974497 RepID=A0A2H0B5H2_9BACT|nr:MAG: cysteine synthase B [Candidatus Beckwithbacteria bacterium CG23_combo_of_CG06-09_8_20_14_all_34_8]